MNMQRFGNVALMVIVLAAGIAVLSAGKRDGYTSLSPEQAAEFIKSTPGLTILDVRTPPEQARGMIPGAIPTYPQAVAGGRVRLPEKGPTLLYCRTGRRSSAAAAALARQGKSDLYEISGGLKAWSRAGLPVVVPALPGRPAS